MAIMLIQLLCPQRHASCAGFYDTTYCTKDEAIVGMERDRVAHRSNPWCGICGSRTLTYKVGATVFTDMEAAYAAGKALEAAQVMTRQQLDALGLTYDSQLKRRGH